MNAARTTLVTLLLAASPELPAVEPIELDPCEVPEDFVVVFVWHERDEEVKVFARISTDSATDCALDPVLVRERRPVAVVLSVHVLCAGRRAGSLRLSLALGRAEHVDGEVVVEGGRRWS